MDIILKRCCGVDVHKKEIKACLLISTANGRMKSKEIKTFFTMTEDLEEFREWLLNNDCKHVAMESTGVYWKPIYNILEEGEIEVTLANARHVKNVPGRKTDVKDCEWLATLYQRGLLKGSLIPKREIRECRELTRRRKRLIQNRSSEINRLQKVLEDANIKLASIASDIKGLSCTRILKAMVSGERDPEKLAELSMGVLRYKIPELKKGLRGIIREHHIIVISQILGHIEFINKQIVELTKEIDIKLKEHKEDIERLSTIPGVEKKTAEVIFVETGGEIDKFKSAGHLCSWAGMCPGNNQSAGKNFSGRARHGNNWLREILVECAWSACKTKDTFLSARYGRLAGRRGKKRAIYALAHRILEIAYHILKDKDKYNELGGDYYLKINETNIKNRCLKTLRSMGYNVILQNADDSNAA